MVRCARPPGWVICLKVEKTNKTMCGFQLHRSTDVHGNSGTGMVAEGVIFSSGKCAMQWLSGVASVAVFDSLSDLMAIHGHGGKTVVLGHVDGCPHTR